MLSAPFNSEMVGHLRTLAQALQKHPEINAQDKLTAHDVELYVNCFPPEPDEEFLAIHSDGLWTRLAVLARIQRGIKKPRV